jgi:hypothetical protein
VPNNFLLDAARAKSKEKEPKKRGPDPETLKLDGRWEDVVKKALKVKPEKPGRVK